MRPAAATANAVATATKSISRTESLELVRCLLRVVSLFGGGGRRRKRTSQPRARVCFFFFLLPSSSVAPPASEHRQASEGPRGGLKELNDAGRKREEKGKRGEG